MIKEDTSLATFYLMSLSAGVLIISSALCLAAFAALWMIPVPQPRASHAD